MPAQGALPAGLFDDARQPLLVGYSGGLDSTVLLHALAATSAARAHGLRALHVHHGLHVQADAWVAHCERVCAGLGVPLAVARVQVEGSGEGAARVARHAAFAGHLRAGEALALAHHRDDQAETFLLRALRGSGVDGLGAMRRWRPFAQGWLWRPLLDVPRQVLRDHAAKHGLGWIEDPSNASSTPDRNFLRHAVLPLLRERWPHVNAAFARGAALQAEAAELLGVEDAVLLAQASGGDGNTLDLRTLRGWPAARRARVLRRWIEQLGLPPLPAQGIACVETELLPARSDAEARFAWAGAELRKWRELLHADWQRPPLPSDFDTRWNGRTPLALPTGDRLVLVTAQPHEAGSFDPPLRAGARQGGERIRLPGRAHSHALKHVLQELGVPPWRRERLPLLFDASQRVVAAGDLAFDADFGAWLQARGARLLWTRD